MNTEDMIKLLNKIGEVKIEHSDFTKKDYVVLKGLNFIRSNRWDATRTPLHHESNHTKAIESFFYDLIDCDEIVMNCNSMNRFETAKNIKIYKFKNNDFVDITKDIITSKNKAMYTYFEML